MQYQQPYMPRISGNKRILAVDDEPAITHLWKVVLEKSGNYTVEEENRSLYAVEAAYRFLPDLILLDVNMPGIDGSEIALQIRADEMLRHTAIVFLTSLVTSEEVTAGKRIEGHLCLPKPTCPRSMVHVIEMSLSAMRAARQPAAC